MAKYRVAHDMNPLGVGKEFLFEIRHQLSNPWKVPATFRPIVAQMLHIVVAAQQDGLGMVVLEAHDFQEV